jgi:prepilin-type N-terminal cleavage/methylation domain-containing protein
MKHTYTKKFDGRNNNSAGFSLLELLVALAIFMVIGGAAVSLVRRHVPLASSVQNQVGLTMTLRSAIAQMELDVVNAGTGYFPGAQIASWPVGVTIVNPQDTACNNTANFTYGATCFDTLNVIAADTSTPPAHPSDIGANCVSTTASSLFIAPVPPETLADLATHFHSGDVILLLTSDGSKITTTTLTNDGSVTGGKVKLPHNPTGADGTSTEFGIADSLNANKLGTQFCDTDWVLKLSPITYSVDVTAPKNPKLIRQVLGGTPDVVAEQIIGFRVGASARVGLVDEPYSFNAAAQSPANGCTANCGYENDWSQVRAVRISLIARTPPNNDPTDTFRNSFDGGPYRIQGASVTINPRNLSMNDQ